MANVTVNSTTANVVVTDVSDSQQIIVTDVETQQQINVSSAPTVVNVSSTTSTIVVSQVGSPGPPGPGAVESVNGETGVVVLDTDNIAEGSNLYFTTARANTAIADYDGDIDTSGNISASNYFGSDGAGSRLTLTGDQVTHGALLGAANTYTVGNQGIVAGYAVLDNTAEAVPPPGMNVVANVSLTTPIVTLAANVLFQGGAGNSNVISVVALEEIGAIGGLTGGATVPYMRDLVGSGNLATLMSNITVGMTIGNFNSLPSRNTIPFTVDDNFAYITEVNVAANTFTISTPPELIINSATPRRINILPAGRDPVTGVVIPFCSQFDVASSLDPGTSKFIVARRPFGGISGGISIPVAAYRGTDIYAYPETGPVSDDFDFSSGLVSGDITLDFTTVAKKGRYVQTANNTTVNFPDGITVGANTISSTDGIGDFGINPGINVMWDGTKDLAAEYNQTSDTDRYQNLITLGIYAFTDGTAADPAGNNFQSATAASTGPRISLGSAYGNITQQPNQNYCRANQELGQIAFTGATSFFRAGFSKSPAAGIKVLAANDWDTSSTTDFGFSGLKPLADRTAGNSDMYLYATSNIAAGRDLFISYKQGELNIGSGKLAQTRKPIKFSPVGTMTAVPPSLDVLHLLNDPRNAYGASSRNWMTLNSANISADSGTQVTITNGGNLGAGVVGDLVHQINRADNTVIDFESDVGFITSGLLQVVWGLAGANGSPDTVGITVPEGNPVLANGSQVAFANVAGVFPQGVNLESNVYYTLAAPVTSSGVRAYALYTDDELTSLAKWATETGNVFEPGNFGFVSSSAGAKVIYDVVSGVTGRDYTFTLAEQSEDLVLSTNGNTHTTFTSDGAITTVGDITANAFVGDGSGLTNVGNVDSVNGETGVVVLDTDDIAEGSNLYFTTARANTAIADYDGDIDTSGNIKATRFRGIDDAELVLTGNTITINTSYGANDTLTLGANIISKGFTVLNPSIAQNGSTLPPVNSTMTYTGNTAIESLSAALTFDQGNATVLVRGLQSYSAGRLAGQNTQTPVPGDLATLMSSIKPGMTLVQKIFGAINQIAQEINVFDMPEQLNHITSVDVANNTFTLNQVYSGFTGIFGGQTFGEQTYYIVNAGIDPVTGAVLPFISEADTGTGTQSNTVIAAFQLRAFELLGGYPESGPVAQDFVFPEPFQASDFTVNFENSPKRALTSIGDIRTAINFPAGITIGANTQASPTGFRNESPVLGITHLWDGTANVRTQYNVDQSQQFLFVPGFTITNFSDGTAADPALPSSSSGITSTGPRLLFSALSGNINQTAGQTICVAGQELGRIAFTGGVVATKNPNSRAPAAGISVATPNDWDFGNQVGNTQNFALQNAAGNADMYLFATSNIQLNTRDVFISYKQGELNLGAGFTNQRKAIKFGPTGNMIPSNSVSPNLVPFLSNPQPVYGIYSRNWMTLNSANISADTGTQVTITNGGNLGAGVVGDLVHQINRADNTIIGFESDTGFITSGLLQFVWGLAGANGSPDTIGIIVPAVNPIIPDGTEISFANVAGAFPQGANLENNVYYTLAAPAVSPGAVSGGIRAYALYKDDELTTLAKWATETGSVFGPGNFGNVGPPFNAKILCDIPSGVTDRDYTFTLAEQSEDLVLSTNGNTHTTFTSDGNITTVGDITATTFTGNLSGTTATLSAEANITGNINLGTNSTVNYDAVYGCFHNLSNVTATTADTVFEFQWPNVHIDTNRVTVESNSQITIGQAGAYVFNLEMAAQNTGNQPRTAFIWLAKNGTDIAETCVKISLFKEDSQNIVKEWIVDDINANDYIEVRFAVDNVTNIQLTSIPAQESPYARPAVPSAVLTVTPVGV